MVPVKKSDDFPEVAAMALKDREAFYGRLSRRMEKYFADTDSLKREYRSLAERNQEIVAIISEEEHSEVDVRTFMEEIKRYATITELDEAVLNRLINRMLIGKH